MESLFLTAHILICIILVGTILIQSGKGASMGAMLGGGASGTLFGARGPATFFQKFTTGLAVLFLFTSVWLAHFARTKTDTSVIDAVTAPAVPTAPVEQPPAEPVPAQTPEPSPKEADQSN